jgi:tRNA-splicing ligase RtcB
MATYELRRVNDAWCELNSEYDVPALVMANENVPVERAALQQATTFMGLTAAASLDLRRMVLTPDVHPGPGIPVGLVAETHDMIVPGAIGNDIGCGMRLLAVDAHRDEIAPLARDRLAARLRQIFFEGQRQVVLGSADREQLLLAGLYGLHESSTVRRQRGLWELYDRDRQITEIGRTHGDGSLLTDRLHPAFSGWVRGTAGDGFDSQLGSVGGGNHFAEIGYVSEVVAGQTAWMWGLRPGTVTVMVHTGSLGFGRAVGAEFAGGRRVLHAGPDAARYVSAMRQAANFAFANRLVLGLMAVRALGDVLGRSVAARLVGDAPHNLIWVSDDASGVALHRKGATPALSPADGPFAGVGEPVLVPGSMGSPSWVLAGSGCVRALSSASHGAGRALSRGRAARTRDGRDELLPVITPVDPAAMARAGRPDLAREHHVRVAEEAPRAYKAVEPVVDSVVGAGAARQVCQLTPLLTVKGR